MLEDYCETFEPLTPRYTPDGAGGTAAQWHAGRAFLGALTWDPGGTVILGGRETPRGAHVLLHERTVTLAPPMRVRRRKGGKLYRVMSASTEVRSPIHSDLPYDMVLLEEVPVR